MNPNRLLFPLSLLAALLAIASGIAAETRGDPRIHLLAVGKGTLKDPPAMQQRAVDAVRLVSEGARAFRPSIKIDAVAEQLMTVPEFRSGEKEEKFNGRIFRQRLRQLAETADPKDTVIIYTHTHGRKDGFEEAQEQVTSQ